MLYFLSPLRGRGKNQPLAGPPRLTRHPLMTDDPKAPAAALLQQGLFHHRQGQLDLAMQRYVDVLQGDPTNADALYYVAVVACEDGQYQQGVDLAKRAIEVGKPQARVHNLMGQAYDRLGQKLEAIKAYDAALALDPNFAAAHGNRASILAETGFPEEALKAYDRALALNANSGADWFNRGTLLHDMGRLQDAIDSYGHALALTPDLPEAHIANAAALMGLGRFDDALADMDRAIKLHPGLAVAHHGRAAALKGLGRDEESKASAARAAELDKAIAEAKTAPSH
jgi:protein O-GlcNAc transferase